MIPTGKELVVWYVELAHAQGWTQTCAAEQLGVDQTTYGLWERRVRENDPPAPRGRAKQALADMYVRVQDKPFRRFTSPLVADAVCRAERPDAFQGFRRTPTVRDKLEFIYSYVLRRGGSQADLDELDDYRNEQLTHSDGDSAESARSEDQEASNPRT
jgi:hypothetical protein